MTNLVSRLRPWVMSMALPVGGIAISYATVIDRPMSQRMAELQTEATKLNKSVQEGSAQHAKNLQQLEQTQRQQRELQKLVSAFPSDGNNAPEETAELSTYSVDSAIARLSATLAMFGRHQVECLASQPVDLASDSKSPTSASDRRVQRITLHGSFANMHGALLEMQSALNCDSLVSLEMEAAIEGETSHRWILILLL